MKQNDIVDELINVHRVHGLKKIVAYLRLSDEEVTEGLFFQAKRTGKAGFPFEGKNYELIKNRDGSFTIALAEDQIISTEDLA